MTNIICWLCDIELVFKDYSDTKLLDENGNKPCYECFLEDKEQSEEEAEDV